MTNDDLPPLPKASFYISNGETWNTPYYASHQLRAVQREAYEAGKRRAALDTVHAIDRELMAEPVAWLTDAAWGRSVSLDRPNFGKAEWKAPQPRVVPLYAHPPQTAPAAPTLADEEITDIFQKYGTGRADGFNAAARAIEAVIHARINLTSIDPRETSQHSTDFGPSWRAGEA
jgi:hypothetical protein